MEETRVLLDQYPDGSVAEAAQQLPSRGNILAQLGGWLVAGASRPCMAMSYRSYCVTSIGSDSQNFSGCFCTESYGTNFESIKVVRLIVLKLVERLDKNEDTSW